MTVHADGRRFEAISILHSHGVYDMIARDAVASEAFGSARPHDTLLTLN